MYPTSLPPPSGAKGHSVSLLALTVVLVLIKYSTGGESTSSYTYVATELTHCALCVLLYSSTVIACLCVSLVVSREGKGDSEVGSGGSLGPTSQLMMCLVRQQPLHQCTVYTVSIVERGRATLRPIVEVMMCLVRQQPLYIHTNALYIVTIVEG